MAWEFTPEEEPLTIHEAVMQALGGASMCWDPTPIGTFRSDRASEIGERLLDYIKKNEKANLGLATTRELLLELESRGHVSSITEDDAAVAKQAYELSSGATEVLSRLDKKLLDYKTVQDV